MALSLLIEVGMVKCFVNQAFIECLTEKKNGNVNVNT